MPHVEVNKFRFLTEVQQPSTARTGGSSYLRQSGGGGALSARTVPGVGSTNTNDPFSKKKGYGNRWRRDLTTTELLPLAAGRLGRNHHVPKPLPGSLLHPLVQEDTPQEQLAKILTANRKTGETTRFIRGDQLKSNVGTHLAEQQRMGRSAELVLHAPRDIVVSDPMDEGRGLVHIEPYSTFNRNDREQHEDHEGTGGGNRVILPKLEHWMPGRSLALERCDAVAQEECEKQRLDDLLGVAANAAAKKAIFNTRPSVVTFGGTSSAQTAGTSSAGNDSFPASLSGPLHSAPGMVLFEGSVVAESISGSRGSQSFGAGSSGRGTFGKVEHSSAYYGAAARLSGPTGTLSATSSIYALGPQTILKNSARQQGTKNTGRAGSPPGRGAVPNVKFGKRNGEDQEPPVSLDEQAAETRAALTRMGEDMLYQMAARYPQHDYVKEARAYGEPHEPLPSKKRYLHMHGLGGIKEAATSDELLENGVQSIGKAALTKQDKVLVEMLLSSGLGGGGGGAVAPSNKSGVGGGHGSSSAAGGQHKKNKQDDDSSEDQPPQETKWNYLLQKNSSQSIHSGSNNVVSEGATRSTQLDGVHNTARGFGHGGAGSMPQQQQLGAQRTVVSSGRADAAAFRHHQGGPQNHLPAMPKKPMVPITVAGLSGGGGAVLRPTRVTTTEERRSLKSKRKLQLVPLVTAGTPVTPNNKVDRVSPPSTAEQQREIQQEADTENLEEEEQAVNPELLRIQEMTQELVQYSDGTIALNHVSSEAQRVAERQRQGLKKRHRGAHEKMEKRKELHARTAGGGDGHGGGGGDGTDRINHPEVMRLLVNRKGRSISQEDADVMVNLNLYGREPALFDVTGEETDAADFPDFPFATGDGVTMATNANEMTDEEKLHRKFERRLLVRQMQRNRLIVDEQDNPQLDWASWRAAANNSVQITKAASKEEVADAMTFQWRQQIEEQKATTTQQHESNATTLTLANHGSGADMHYAADTLDEQEDVITQLPCLAVESLLRDGLGKI